MINKNKLYFLFTVETNIFNNIMILDEKYKNNIVSSDTVLENRKGPNGEMYSILLISDAFSPNEIRDSQIVIKIIYRKNGTEDHIFLSNAIKIDKLRNNFCYNFILNSETRWLGLKKIPPPNSLNLTLFEKYKFFNQYIQNNCIKNEDLFSDFINDAMQAYIDNNSFLNTETFCVFDQYLIDNNLVGGRVHNQFLYKIISQLSINKTFLTEFVLIFIQYLNSNKYIDMKYNVIDSLLQKFGNIIEKDFFIYTTFLKEIQESSLRLKNFVKRFNILNMKFNANIQKFSEYEELIFRLLDNPSFLVKDVFGEIRENEIKKIYLLALVLLKHCPINQYYPIVFTSIAQFEVIMETHAEYARYLYDQNFITSRIFPITHYNEIINCLNKRKSLEKLKNILLNKNRIFKTCFRENKVILIEELDNNLIISNIQLYKDLYKEINQYQILKKYYFIEWGKNLSEKIENKNILNDYPIEAPLNNNYPINNYNNDNINLYPKEEIKYIHQERLVNGYPEELLIDKSIVDNSNFNIECEICLGLLNFPISCSQCGKNFCRKCIGDSQEKSNKCPNCRDIFQGINCDINTINFLNNIQLKCYHFKEGCNEIFNYGNLKNHILNCPYGEYECPFDNCKYIGFKKDMNEHIRNCSLIEEKCNYCFCNIKRINMKEHMKKCGESLINCEFCFMKVKLNDYNKHILNCENNGIICFNCFNLFTQETFLTHNELICVKILFKTFKRDFRIERARRIQLENENVRLNNQVNDLRRQLNNKKQYY